MKIAFGCRAPTSIAGSWGDGAYVTVVDNRNVVTCAVFQGNKDYVNNKISLKDGIAQYETQISLGWVPMTREDLSSTAGIKIDDNTICDIGAVKSYIASDRINFALYFVFCFAIAYLLPSLLRALYVLYA